jgi:hypothetical protein
MSNLTLWSRPWDTDRWLRDFFGPAGVVDWFKPQPFSAGWSPAAAPDSRPRRDSRHSQSGAADTIGVVL